MARRTKTTLHAVGEINLVPMLDFAFLLLTVFLITYPLMEPVSYTHLTLPTNREV